MVDCLFSGLERRCCGVTVLEKSEDYGCWNIDAAEAGSPQDRLALRHIASGSNGDG